MVDFSYHDVDQPSYLDESVVRDWLIDCASSLDAAIQQYSVVLCSDSYLLDLNQQYLRHHDYTDIITFDYGSHDLDIAGEAYISLERTLENAALFNTAPGQELLRVMAHGLLHLLGFGDKTEKEVQKMRAMESQFLARYPSGKDQ